MYFVSYFAHLAVKIFIYLAIKGFYTCKLLVDPAHYVLEVSC